MSWSLGLTLVGLGATIFFPCAQLLGLILPRWVLVLGAAGGFLLMLVWPLSHGAIWLRGFVGPEHRSFVFALVLIIGAILGMIVTGGVWLFSEPTSAKPDVPKPEIFIECNRAALPMSIPPDGRVRFVDIQESGGIGLMEMISQTGRLTWEPVTWGYRCEVTNYSLATIFDVSMVFTLRFRESVRKPGSDAWHAGSLTSTRTLTVQATKIDPGINETFVFYIRNRTPRFLDGDYPNSVRFHLPEGDRIAPVLRPKRPQIPGLDFDISLAPDFTTLPPLAGAGKPATK